MGVADVWWKGVPKSKLQLKQIPRSKRSIIFTLRWPPLSTKERQIFLLVLLNPLTSHAIVGESLAEFVDDDEEDAQRVAEDRLSEHPWSSDGSLAQINTCVKVRVHVHICKDTDGLNLQSETWAGLQGKKKSFAQIEFGVFAIKGSRLINEFHLKETSTPVLERARRSSLGTHLPWLLRCYCALTNQKNPSSTNSQSFSEERREAAARPPHQPHQDQAGGPLTPYVTFSNTHRSTMDTHPHSMCLVQHLPNMLISLHSRPPRQHVLPSWSASVCVSLIA